MLLFRQDDQEHGIGLMIGMTGDTKPVLSIRFRVEMMMWMARVGSTSRLPRQQV